jgi:hypothetical protein
MTTNVPNFPRVTVSPLISFFSSSKEFELYEIYSPRHPSCHQLRSEQVEVEGMDIPEGDGMNMVEEQDHPMNHRLGRRI